MIKIVLLVLLLSSFSWCAKGLELTRKQAEFIAQKVWQNEGARKDKYLIWWNEGEDFASLGIGHFIWFPPDHTERFREVFPMVLEYMQKRGVKFPEWLTPQSDFPWRTKKEFFFAKKANTRRYRDLFKFLKETFAYQAEFMAHRALEALPNMLNSINDPKLKTIIERRFKKMLYRSDGKIDERGLYILIDYTNFKGEGTLQSERYNGYGWGLLQVLEHMDENAENKYKAFAKSAEKMLLRRIRNSPPERGEIRWKKGWMKRLETYWR